MTTRDELSTAYHDVFRSLGVMLQPSDGVPEDEIASAEDRLGIRVPVALRVFYLLAGRETRLNQAFNHLLAPAEWWLDRGHLAFMEENQAVVFWGIQTGSENDDPPVGQGVNGERVDWYPEHERTSEFLAVQLHWQAVMGGLRYGRSIAVAPSFAERLDIWHYAGECNDMRAYSRGGVALCFMKWGHEWRVFIASDSGEEIAASADGLGIPRHVS